MMRTPISVFLLSGLVSLVGCNQSTPPAKQQKSVPQTAETPAATLKPVKVEVVLEDGQYRLLRNGKPYLIKGAGIARPKGVDPDGYDLAQFAAHGGNSFRNWRDRDAIDGMAILDDAARHGLTVAMSIPVGLERKGFDYDDAEAVARQMAYARGEVLKYKDHPALLLWIVGNEINFDATNPRVFNAVNDIAKMIHELDPNHPVTTTLTGYGADLANLAETRMPNLDIISVQLYADVVNLPERLKQSPLSRPVMVTEWGTQGHWEVDKTSWGAPIEMNSSEKARHYLTAYRDAIAAVPGQIIGSYAFVWGQKQERTPTWYGLFLEDGSETESIDVLHHIWRGEWPENRAPGIESMTLNGAGADEGVTLESGSSYAAMVAAADPDDDELSFRWEIMRESEATQVGGDKEDIPEKITGRLKDAEGPSVVVRAPEQSGAYRLFVYVYDGHGNAGHANIPFLVQSP